MLSEENRCIYTVQSNVFYTKSEEIGANLHTHKRIFYIFGHFGGCLLYLVSESVVKGY